MNDWLEHQRDIFLCAIYDQHFETAESVFLNVANFAVSAPDLTEYHQKILFQFMAIFSRFKKELTAGCSGQILPAVRKTKHLLSAYAGAGSNSGPAYIDYAEFRKLIPFPEPGLEILYQTVTTFQLTSGCSHYCQRCNEWALPNIRKHFSFTAVKQILQDLVDSGNTGFALYGASDPLDWEDGLRDIRHIMAFLKENQIRLTFGLLTKIPKKKEALFMDLVQQKTDIAVSVTNRNRDRVKKIEAVLPGIEKQHDSDDLLIPACRDEDFQTVKSSITDTYGTEISPDGIFLTIPSLTSALNPFGHKKIPVTCDTVYFLQKKTGEQALKVDYFKPLEAITLSGKTYRLATLLDTQIETLLLDNGSNDLNVPGMTNIREYFDIFKPAAIQKRQKMLPAVMKRLKTTQRNCPDYLDQIHACIDFCRPEPVRIAKLCAVSFFLTCIRSYAEQNAVRTRLIYHLRKSYIARLDRKFSFLPDTADIQSLLTDSSVDSFLLFEYLKFKSLLSADAQNISTFIQNYNAVFDTLSDRFIPQDR